MKTILLPFYDDDAAEAALDVSRQLADRFGSYVEGLFVMRPPQIIDGEGIVLADSYLTQLKEEGRRLGDRARSRFDACVAGRAMVAGSLAEPADGVAIVIAWNNSTETARTVAFAMPLLARASSVTIVAVRGWGVPGPSADELCRHLVRNGIAATARTIEPDHRSPGEVVLDECAAAGADLLVKGAYTQSRLRQLIFGGATRHIMMHAKIPVILAH